MGKFKQFLKEKRIRKSRMSGGSSVEIHFIPNEEYGDYTVRIYNRGKKTHDEPFFKLEDAEARYRELEKM